MTTRTIEDYVGHWLRRAHLVASATLTQYLKKYDVTPAQLAAMLKLREVGRVSQNELGRMVAMEPANIHRIVSALQSKKLVLVGQDSDDARKSIIRLSNKGSELVEELEPLHEYANRETLSVLTAAEKERLIELLKKVSSAGAPEQRAAGGVR